MGGPVDWEAMKDNNNNKGLLECIPQLEALHLLLQYITNNYILRINKFKIQY